MRGELVLSTQRGPDFFALYRQQGGPFETWVQEDPEGRLVGMGSLLVRDGWLAGAPARVGYLGDLRTRFASRRSGALAHFYGAVLREAQARHGVSAFLTAVLASNQDAMQSLVRRSSRRPEQPQYHPFRRFTLRSIRFQGRRRRRSTPFELRTATPEDLPAIRERLAEDHRQRPFGERFDQGAFEQRLSAWPGFALEQTWLAFENEALVGLTSVWDPSPVKRYRVEAWNGPLRWQRLAFNAGAAVLGWTRLPPAGAILDTLHLCNTWIQDDRPEVLEALLEDIYAWAQPRGHHLLSAPVYEGDPLGAAFRRFNTRGLDFHLYVVLPPGQPLPELGGSRPGFEPSLA